MKPSAAVKPGEVISIQYLRGLAALAVLLCHASMSLLTDGRSLIHLEAGGAGVDLFFVISGFIMVYTTMNRPMTTWEFYVRRFVRIFPLYFAASSLAFLIARVAPSATRTFSGNFLDYARSILFIPYYTTTAEAQNSLIPLMRPELGQGWTLNYEVFFYLIFGLCLYLPLRYRMRSFVGVMLALVSIGIVFQPAHAIPNTYTNSLLLEFVFGAVLGFLMLRSLPRSATRARLIMLIAASAASVCLQSFTAIALPRVVAFGLPAAAMVAVALSLERARWMPRWPALLLFGDASYSIYLLHGFVLAVLRRLWQRYFDVALVSTHLGFILVSTVAALVVGIVVYAYAERPVTLALTAWLKRAGVLGGSPKAIELRVSTPITETIRT